MVILYFIGGVTHSELAALRHMGRRTGRKIIIATTNVTNGSALVQSCVSPS